MINMEEEWVCFADIYSYLKKRKWRWVLFASGCSLTMVASYLLIPPQFILEAAFKEASVHYESSSTTMLKTLLKAPGGADLGAQALSIMKSKSFLQKIIADTGLQGELTWYPLKRHYIKTFLHNFYRIFHREKECELLPYKIRSLEYEGKSIERWILKFNPQYGWGLHSLTDPTLHVVVADKNGIFHTPSFKAAIDMGAEKDEESLLLEVYPKQLAVDKVLKKLRIKVRREDSSILDFAYRDHDSHRGVRFLNHFMHEYQEYLMQENTRMAQSQLAYLKARQKEMTSSLDTTLEEHVKYLQGNLDEKGFMGLHQELEMIDLQRRKHQQRLLEIDLAQNKLERIEKKHFIFSDLSCLGEEGQGLQQQMLTLKKQKDGLDLSQLMKLSSAHTSKRRSKIAWGYPKHHELDWLQEQGERLDKEYRLLPIFSRLNTHLYQIEQEKKYYERFGNIVTNEDRQLDEALMHVQQLCDELTELEGSSHRKNIHQHMQELLGIQQRILEERLVNPEHFPEEFEGIDLIAAKKLQMTYTEDLDHHRIKVKQWQSCLDKMQAEDDAFEFSSLTALVNDPLSIQMIQDAMLVSSELKHEKYFSDKDRARLKEDLIRKSKQLAMHIEQMQELACMKIGLIEDKLRLLHQKMTDLLTREMIFIEQQIEHYVKDRLEVLAKERDYIQEKLQLLYTQMHDIPNKWLFENKMQLQADLSVAMMEGMAQLVETKNIEHHLAQIESKPIDEAQVPLQPKKTSLIVLIGVGAFLGGVCSMGASVIIQMIRGFPLSIEGLYYRGASIIKHPATLHKIIPYLLSEQRQILGVCWNKMGDYSASLARFLHKSGKSVLVIELVVSDDKKPGLFSYLIEEITSLPIYENNGIDIITWGASDSDQFDLLYTERFVNLLEKLKSTYSKIVFVVKSTLKAYDAIILKQFCDQLLLEYNESSFEIVSSYRSWEKKKGYSAILWLEATGH